MVGQFSQLTLQSFVAGRAGTGLPYHPLFHHYRAMWATMVALACGVIGAIAILVAVPTGHKFDHASSQVDPALAELLYDFAALQAAGIPGATAQVEFVPASEPGNTETASPPLASQPEKGCTRATWSFFDNDCLWGNADSGTQERRRRRIVARLKSPWYSGLRSNDGAYFCRSRS